MKRDLAAWYDDAVGDARNDTPAAPPSVSSASGRTPN